MVSADVADIEACFDSIEHTALMDQVRARVTPKRVSRRASGAPQWSGTVALSNSIDDETWTSPLHALFESRTANGVVETGVHPEERVWSL